MCFEVGNSHYNALNRGDDVLLDVPQDGSKK